MMTKIAEFSTYTINCNVSSVRKRAHAGLIVEPLYKGQVKERWGHVLTGEPLHIRDKLGTCPYSGASLQGTSWGRVLCPLYRGASRRCHRDPDRGHVHVFPNVRHQINLY